LQGDPDNVALFGDELPLLCSEDITWSLAFAAAPHLVEFARRSQPAVRLQYVCFLGQLAMYRVSHEEVEPNTRCPSDLEADFNGAIVRRIRNGDRTAAIGRSGSERSLSVGRDRCLQGIQ
jgi:hypothetical protein